MWHESDEDAPPTISGGTFEISTGIAGGAFCYYDYDEEVYSAITPDITYAGAYKMTAGANADGTGAVDYSASNSATYKYVKLELHVHNYGTTWKSDENSHRNECECGDKANEVAHTASEWIIDTAATATTEGTKHKECTVCGYVMENGTIPATGSGEHTHSYGSEWKSDADKHWHECECGDKADETAHVDENNDGKCDICDYEISNSNNPGGNTDLKKKGLSGGAIAGIVVGSVAVAGLGGFSIFWFVIKKKKFADLFRK